MRPCWKVVDDELRTPLEEAEWWGALLAVLISAIHHPGVLWRPASQIRIPPNLPGRCSQTSVSSTLPRPAPMPERTATAMKGATGPGRRRNAGTATMSSSHRAARSPTWPGASRCSPELFSIRRAPPPPSPAGRVPTPPRRGRLTSPKPRELCSRRGSGTLGACADAMSFRVLRATGGDDPLGPAWRSHRSGLGSGCRAFRPAPDGGLVGADGGRDVAACREPRSG